MGVGIYSILLTLAILAGIISSFINRKLGWTILFVSSICWLLRYFEHAAYLILYDFQNLGRWILVVITILFSFALFTLIYKARQEFKGKTFKIRFLSISLFAFLAIGLFSFIRKPHRKEFNCWYNFNNTQNNFTITFAITPGQTLEVSSNSNELKEFIKKNGIFDEFRKGFYCPQTKVRVITRFKEIVSIDLVEFRNTKINKTYRFENPVAIDINSIKGNKQILQPEFSLGD